MRTQRTGTVHHDDGKLRHYIRKGSLVAESALPVVGVLCSARASFAACCISLLGISSLAAAARQGDAISSSP